jgi:hypothetical protein
MEDSWRIPGVTLVDWPQIRTWHMIHLRRSVSWFGDHPGNRSNRKKRETCKKEPVFLMSMSEHGRYTQMAISNGHFKIFKVFKFT